MSRHLLHGVGPPDAHPRPLHHHCRVAEGHGERLRCPDSPQKGACRRHLAPQARLERIEPSHAPAPRKQVSRIRREGAFTRRHVGAGVPEEDEGEPAGEGVLDQVHEELDSP